MSGKYRETTENFRLGLLKKEYLPWKISKRTPTFSDSKLDSFSGKYRNRTEFFRLENIEKTPRFSGGLRRIYISRINNRVNIMISLGIHKRKLNREIFRLGARKNFFQRLTVAREEKRKNEK